MCGSANFTMAKIERIFVRKVFSTTARSMSLMSLTNSCMAELFIRTLSLEKASMWESIAFLQFSSDVMSRGRRFALRPAASMAFFVAWASSSSSGRYTKEMSAPSRAMRMATERPMPVIQKCYLAGVMPWEMEDLCTGICARD